MGNSIDWNDYYSENGLDKTKQSIQDQIEQKPAKLQSNVVDIETRRQKQTKQVGSKEEESVLAERLASLLNNAYGYDPVTDEFVQKYNDYWPPITESKFLVVLFAKMSELLPGGFSNSKLKAVKELLKIFLAIEAWEIDRRFLPVKNGVLDTVTRQLLPYREDQYFRWQLPYSYDPKATCFHTLAWLGDVTEGDEGKIATLRAFIKALLTGKRVQKFLEIIGPGGTGKSTFVTLLSNLVGLENITSTDLYNLEKNRFETASLYGKLLAVISDADIYGGAVSVLKAVTGGDPLRFERKNQQQCAPFIFLGLLVLVANQPPQTTDYTSGLARRRLVVYFRNKVTDEDKRKYQAQGGIDAVLKSELPGILNWALEMPDAEMYDAIQSISKGLNHSEREHLCDTNKLAAWVDEMLVVDEKATLPIGHKGEADSERYKLYPNYLKWCRQSGANPIGLRNFTNNLADLCEHVGISAEKLRRNKHGVRFRGLAIREADDVKYRDCLTPIIQQTISFDDGV